MTFIPPKKLPIIKKPLIIKTSATDSRVADQIITRLLLDGKSVQRQLERWVGIRQKKKNQFPSDK